MNDGVGQRVRQVLGKARKRTARTVAAAKSQPDRRTETVRKIDGFKTPTPKAALPLRAAVVAGERIAAGLAWEWQQTRIDATTWQTALQPGAVDVVLVEMVGSAAAGWGSDASLPDLFAWAGEHTVPVVAWVTAGSTDPDAAKGWVDAVHTVFLDDAEQLDAWRSRWPDARIDVLAPAAQPRVHNPVIGGAAIRREELVAVLYHGRFDGEDKLAELDNTRVDLWPADADASAAVERSPLKASVVPGHRRLPVGNPALSRYRVLGELGPAAGPSWHAVEAGACQTPVVVEHNNVHRIAADLREHVAVAEDADAVRPDVAARVWQGELRDREGVRLAREIHARHTFGRRVDTIAGAVGLDAARPSRTVSAVVPTNRAHELDNVFANLGRQAHRDVELILVLHGLSVPDAKARAADAGIENMQVIEADSSLTLGACMNLGVDAANGQFIAKMDDDNFYGEHYLTDLVAAFDYTDAGITGKWAHYVWLRSMGAVLVRTPKAEHRYERLVQGGSIVLRADVARELRFGDHLPRGVDTDILNRAKAAGIRTYSADRFNYVSVRGADRHAHTWNIADTALMNRAGRLVFYGDPREHVSV